MLDYVQAIRYVTPLHEGGSLPGIIEADDEGTHVMKFRRVRIRRLTPSLI